MKVIFRILIFIALFALVMPLIIPHQTPTFMPHLKDEINKLSINGLEEFEDLVNTLIYIGVFSLILLLISLVGLFFFWNPSRELFIASMILLLIIVGFKIQDKDVWISMMFSVLFYVSAIAIIIISYLSPTKKYFSGSKS